MKLFSDEQCLVEFHAAFNCDRSWAHQSCYEEARPHWIHVKGLVMVFGSVHLCSSATCEIKCDFFLKSLYKWDSIL